MYRKQFYGEVDEIQADSLKQLNDDARKRRLKIRGAIRRAKQYPVLLECIRFANTTDVGYWKYSVQLSFDAHQRPWLTPRLALLREDAKFVDKIAYGVEAAFDNHRTRKGEKATHILIATHRIQLARDFTVEIYIKEPRVIDISPESEYKLPNGCSVKREINANLSDTMNVACSR